MQQITFEVESNEDANLLIAIANKLGIKKYGMSKRRGKNINTGSENLLTSGQGSETEEKQIETKISSAFIEADNSIDISNLDKIFTGKKLDAGTLRKSLWHREK